MKLEDTIELVRESMLAAGATQEMVNKTLKDIEKAAQEEKEDRKNAPKKSKNDFLVLLSDPEGKITEPVQSWVFQVEKDCPPMALLERVKTAATEFNNSKRGRKHPVYTCGEAIESIPAKYWKTGTGLTRPKTKTPVWAIPTNNKV